MARVVRMVLDGDVPVSTGERCARCVVLVLATLLNAGVVLVVVYLVLQLT
jgi:hypothetical protein